MFSWTENSLKELMSLPSVSCRKHHGFFMQQQTFFFSFFVHLCPMIIMLTKAENVFSLLYSGLSNWSCLRKNFLLFSFCLTYCAIKIPQNKVQLEVKKNQAYPPTWQLFLMKTYVLFTYVFLSTLHI